MPLSDPLAFVARAEAAFGKFHDVRVRDQAVRGIRCYFTGENRGAGRFDTTRFSVRDKHGFEHHVFNQKFNVTLKPGGEGAAEHPLFIGKQQADLADFAAIHGP